MISYPATDCITLLDISFMLLKKLLAPLTTPPSIAEFPDDGDGDTGGPLAPTITDRRFMMNTQFNRHLCLLINNWHLALYLLRSDQ